MKNLFEFLAFALSTSSLILSIISWIIRDKKVVLSILWVVIFTMLGCCVFNFLIGNIVLGLVWILNIAFTVGSIVLVKDTIRLQEETEEILNQLKN